MKLTTDRLCPICAKPIADKKDIFCSPRCADVDLHRWLSGRYVIPGKEDEAEDEAPVPIGGTDPYQN